MFHSFSPNYFLVHLRNKALFLPQGSKEGKIFLRTIYCKRMISVPTVCLILIKKIVRDMIFCKQNVIIYHVFVREKLKHAIFFSKNQARFGYKDHPFTIHNTQKESSKNLQLLVYCDVLLEKTGKRLKA